MNEVTAPRRALVVDDDPDILRLLDQVLAIDGFAVELHDCGDRAVEAAAGPPPVDVVVLDVQMPGVDGWEVLHELRSSPATGHVAVVMCTVKARAADELRAWELGCDGFVAKPFDVAALLAEVELVTGLSMEARRVRRERAASHLRGVLADGER